jgi:hypothetical protein
LRSATSSAAAATRSNARQLALKIAVSFSSRAASTRRASAFGAASGAPKSVVALPGRRSATRSPDGDAGGANPSFVPRSTRAYRGAYSNSAATAVSSSRPARCHPGHPTAPANTRFVPVST